MKLDADWVVLSACNTGAGAGAGAEAASGLGRAFFYAGTRALLVTNWSVHSQSARELVTDLFQPPGRRSESSTRGEALRQAMMAMVDGRGYHRHRRQDRVRLCASAVLGALHHHRRRREALNEKHLGYARASACRSCGWIGGVCCHDYPATGGRTFRRERREGMPGDRRQTDRAGLRAIAHAASGRQAAKVCSSLPDRCHSCRPGLHPADRSTSCGELPQYGRPPHGSGLRSKPRSERRRPTGPLRRAVPVVDLLGGAGMRMALGRGDTRGGRPIGAPDTFSIWPAC